MRGGNRQKPTAVQIAAGDPRKIGKRKLEQRLAAEPKAAKGLPPAPIYLDERAKAAYEFWRQELENMGLDARPDGMMLEGAAVNYSRAVQSDISVTKEGVILAVPIFNKEGDQVGERFKPHPAIAISNQAWKNVKAFCSEFGLSPVSRTRLSIDKKESATDDLVALLSTPRPESKNRIVQ